MNLFFYFLLALFVGGMFITGWYNITRGDWRTNPDSTKYWGGKLFSPWLRFWEQHEKKPMYYAGLELQKLAFEFESRFKLVFLSAETVPPTTGHWYAISSESVDDKVIARSIIVGPATKKMFDERFFIIGENICFTAKTHINGNWSIFFFKEKPVYKFPEWLRDPLAACIFCFSSVYGTFCWAMIAFAMKIYLGHLPFHWYVLALVWPCYCICLSFLSPYLKKLSN